MSHPEHSRESLPLFQQDSCGTVEGHGIKTEPSSHLGHSRSIFDANDGEAGHGAAANTGLDATREGQSEYQASPAGMFSAHARKSDGPNSHQAAQSVTNLGPVRDAILDILSMGDFTDSEIEQWYSDRQKTWRYPLSSPSGLRSRRSELVTMGFVHEVGTGKTKSGRPCAIWALKERKA